LIIGGVNTKLLLPRRVIYGAHGIPFRRRKLELPFGRARGKLMLPNPLEERRDLRRREAWAKGSG
jgi:hypothetical protein